jgi:hypothetical protein
MRKILLIFAIFLFIVLIILALTSLALYIAGCSARSVHASMRVTIPRECIKSVQLSDHTKCMEQKDGSLVCAGLLLTTYRGCGAVKIRKEEIQ